MRRPSRRRSFSEAGMVKHVENRADGVFLTVPTPKHHSTKQIPKGVDEGPSL